MVFFYTKFLTFLITYLSNQLLLVTLPFPPKSFIKIRPQLVELSCWQSDRPTHKTKTVTSLAEIIMVLFGNQI